MLKRPPGPWACSPSLPGISCPGRTAGHRVRSGKPGGRASPRPRPLRPGCILQLGPAGRAPPRLARLPPDVVAPYLGCGWAGTAAPQGVRHWRSVARRRLQTLQSRARGRLCMQTPSQPRAPSLPGPAPGAGPVGRAGPAGWCERSFDPAPGAGPAGGRGQRGGARALSRSEPLRSFLSPSGPRRRILPGRKSPSRPAPPPSPSFSAVY